MHRTLLVLPCLLALLAGPTAALMAAVPRPGAPLLVLVGPFADAEAILTRAGTRAIGPVRAPLALIAEGGDAGLPLRLRQAGALFVADGQSLTFLCGP